VAGLRIGYVRVSTLDQNGQHQLDGLVLDRVFTDKASGRRHRQTAADGAAALCPRRDTVVVHRRTGWPRNLDDLRALVHQPGDGLSVFTARDPFVKALEDNPDHSHPMDKQVDGIAIIGAQEWDQNSRANRPGYSSPGVRRFGLR
jgi:DNA invertase Pin-like site-specific DNA recombinase